MSDVTKKKRKRRTLINLLPLKQPKHFEGETSNMRLNSGSTTICKTNYSGAMSLLSTPLRTFTGIFSAEKKKKEKRNRKSTKQSKNQVRNDHGEQNNASSPIHNTQSDIAINNSFSDDSLMSFDAGEISMDTTSTPPSQISSRDESIQKEPSDYPSQSFSFLKHNLEAKTAATPNNTFIQNNTSWAVVTPPTSAKMTTTSFDFSTVSSPMHNFNFQQSQSEYGNLSQRNHQPNIRYPGVNGYGD